MPDYPNARSLHHAVVSRSGGIAIVGAALFAGVAAFSSGVVAGWPIPWIGMSLILLVPVMLLDDHKGASISMRLVFQGMAMVVLLSGGLAITEVTLPGLLIIKGSTFLAYTLVAVLGVWMINLYNFMDGMDGLAAGMAVFGFVTFAIFGWLHQAPSFSGASLIVAGAAGGFLVHNFPPARLFMGDSGSSSLGLLATAFTLWGEVEGIIPLWMSLVLFSPFIADASITLFRRAVRGKAVWRAHREHYYQRLARTGLGHRRTVVLEYVLMAACAGSVLLADRFGAGEQWLLLTGWVGFYGLFFALFPKVEEFLLRKAT